MSEVLEVDTTFPETEEQLEAMAAEPVGEIDKRSRFKVEYIEQARKLCEQFGAVDTDLVTYFRCSERAFYNWKRRYPQFRAACRLGKDSAIERVAMTVYKRACGYEYPSEKVHVTKDGKIVRVSTTEHVPGSERAQEFYLTNRDPDNWRIRREVTGAEGKPLIPYEGNELARRVVAVLDPRFAAKTKSH